MKSFNIVKPYSIVKKNSEQSSNLIDYISVEFDRCIGSFEFGKENTSDLIKGLRELMQHYVKSNISIPTPEVDNDSSDDIKVNFEPYIYAKIILFNEFLKCGMNRTKLAMINNVSNTTITKALDPKDDMISNLYTLHKIMKSFSDNKGIFNIILGDVIEELIGMPMSDNTIYGNLLHKLFDIMDRTNEENLAIIIDDYNLTLITNFSDYLLSSNKVIEKRNDKSIVIVDNRKNP